jgi:hypothetical protein
MNCCFAPSYSGDCAALLSPLCPFLRTARLSAAQGIMGAAPHQRRVPFMCPLGTAGCTTAAYAVIRHIYAWAHVWPLEWHGNGLGGGETWDRSYAPSRPDDSLMLRPPGRSALQVSRVCAGPLSAGGSSVPVHGCLSPWCAASFVGCVLSTYMRSTCGLFSVKPGCRTLPTVRPGNCVLTASPRGTAPAPRLVGRPGTAPRRPRREGQHPFRDYVPRSTEGRT